MMEKRVAVVDVGTNTVLYLLMARREDGTTVVEEEDVVPTRLGEGIASGRPSPVALERTVAAVTGLAARARAAGVKDIIIVGTEVLRRPAWRYPFQRRLMAAGGLAATVLTPQREGELVLTAARRSLPLGTAPIVVVDVGGGSVQIIREEARGGAVAVTSYPLGCVYLTERFLMAGGAGAWEEARAYVDNVLVAECAAAGVVVVTGGTAAAAVTLDKGSSGWDLEVIHGARLRRTTLEDWAEKVYHLGGEARRALPGMPPGRGDVFPAGALVLAAVFRRLGCEDAVVSARGLRYGVAYHFFDGEDNP